MVQRIFAVLVAGSMLVAALSGCKPKDGGNDLSSEISSSQENSGEVSQAKTPEEEAAENNAQIPQDSVQLVQFNQPKAGDIIANINTNMGMIKILLFPEIAPKTVENFVGLAQKGYYDGVIFHRVINGFMIQGGDPSGTGMGGESIFATEEDMGEFEDEFSLNLWNFRGALSMANRGPNTNTSQFFIVQKDFVEDEMLEQLKELQYPEKVIEKYTEIGGTPHLDWKHTVFGFVIEGMDIVDAIAAVEVDANAGPLEQVVMESVTIEEVK